MIRGKSDESAESTHMRLSSLMHAMFRPSALAGDAPDRDGTANGGLWQPERGVRWSCFMLGPRVCRWSEDARRPTARGHSCRPATAPDLDTAPPPIRAGSGLLGGKVAGAVERRS